MEELQAEIEQAHLQLQQAQQRMAAAVAAGDEIATKEHADAMKLAAEAVANAEKKQADLSALAAQKETGEAETVANQLKQARADLAAATDDSAKAEMQDQVNSLAEALLKEEAEAVEAQQRAAQEMEEALVAKEQQEDLEADALVAVAEAVVVRETVEAEQAVEESKVEQAEWEVADERAKVLEQKALEMQAAVAEGGDRLLAQQAHDEAETARKEADREKAEADKAAAKAQKELQEAAAAAIVLKQEKAEAERIKQTRAGKKEASNALKAQTKVKLAAGMNLFKLKELADGKKEEEDAEQSTHTKQVAIAANFRSEADEQYGELQKAQQSEALVKEAKVEEMRALSKDAITDDLKAETDKLKQIWESALQAENELQVKCTDAQDGAFTPMKRKVADEAKAEHEVAVKVTKAAKKAVQVEEMKVKEAETVAAAAWKLADDAPSFRAAEAVTAEEQNSFDVKDELAKAQEDAADVIALRVAEKREIWQVAEDKRQVAQQQHEESIDIERQREVKLEDAKEQYEAATASKRVREGRLEEDKLEAEANAKVRVAELSEIVKKQKSLLAGINSELSKAETHQAKLEREGKKTYETKRDVADDTRDQAEAAKKAATEAEFQMNFAKTKLGELEKEATAKKQAKREAEKEEDRAAKEGDDDAEGLATSKIMKIERELAAIERKADQWGSTYKFKSTEDVPEAWEKFNQLDGDAEKAELELEQAQAAVADTVNAARIISEDLRQKVSNETHTLDKHKKELYRAKVQLKRASAEAFAVISKPKEIEDALIKMEEPFVVQAGLYVRTFSGHALPASQLIVGHGNLWSAGLDRNLKRWELNENDEAAVGSCMRTYPGHFAAVRCTTLFRDCVFTASDDTVAIQWDLETAVKRFNFEGHTLPIWDMCCVDDGDDGVLITSSSDRTIRMWDLTDGRCERVFGREGGIFSEGAHRAAVVAVGCLGHFVYSASVDCSIKFWDRELCDPVDTIERAHDLPINCFTLDGSSTNASMITGSQDCTAKWWDLETKKEIKTFVAHKGPITATSLCGVLLLTGSTDGTCKAWSLETGAILRTFWMDQSGVSSICCTVEHVFVGLADSTIRQYKLDHGGDPQKGNFSILLTGERVRLFGEIAQLQVKQAHVDRLKDEELNKLKRKEAVAKKKALLNRRKKDARNKDHEEKLEEAQKGGHFGELYDLMEDADPEAAAKLKAEEDAAREAERTATMEKLRMEALLLDKHEAERARKVKEEESKEAKKKAKEERKRRKAELEKKKAEDFKKFREEAKVIAEKFNTMF